LSAPAAFGVATGILALAAMMPAGHAFELTSIEATRDGPAYVLRIEADFQATPDRVLAVLSNYDEIHRLHRRMVESRSLGEVGPATTEVVTRFEGCVLVFCRTVHRVEHIKIEGFTLRAVDVPGAVPSPRAPPSGNSLPRKAARSCVTRRASCPRSRWRPWSGRRSWRDRSNA
jgi:hypothetical protein